MKSLALKFGLVLLTLLPALTVSSCVCEDYVNLYVFAGRRTAAECERLSKKQYGDPETPTFTCPGEEVTICWSSNKQIQLEPGFGIQPATGMQVLKVDADTTITATPLEGCAGAKEAHVNVVTEDTPSTWTGRWNLDCTFISFSIDGAFVSTQIRAKDITAQWAPVVDGVACSTPPFLDGFHVEEVFGFPIDRPFITEAFTRNLRAVGTWRFTVKAICPTAYRCDPTFRGPFNVTLTCAR